MARFRGRQSRRERLLSNKRAIDFLAAGADKRHAFTVPIPAARKPRARRSASTTPLERDVLASVLAVLRHDPRVAIVDRRQSGLFQEGERYIRIGNPGHLDISGMLKGGRYFELECKRDDKAKPDERQAARIELIKRLGGVSGYCWSVESALALLP